MKLVQGAQENGIPQDFAVYTNSHLRPIRVILTALIMRDYHPLSPQADSELEAVRCNSSNDVTDDDDDDVNLPPPPPISCLRSR